MFKGIVVSLLLLTGLSTGVYAQDFLRFRRAEPTPLSGFSWEGPYVTAFVGAGKAQSTATEVTTTANDPGLCAPAGTAGVPAGMYWCNVNNMPHYTSTPTPSYNQIGDTWGMSNAATMAGIGAGYNLQFGDMVVGGEVDGGYLRIRGKSGFSPASIDDTTLHVDSNLFATARLRLGYAFDRILLFATVGGALGSFNAYVQDADTPIGIRTFPTATQFGFVFGGGVEFAITDHLILKGEVLSMRFDGGRSEVYTNLTCYPGIVAGVCNPASAAYWKTGRLSDTAGALGAWNISQVVNIARAGLSYKF